MATSSSTSAPVGPETPISIKINVNGVQKKFKLPLADLVPGILPGKLRSFLGLPDNQAAVFERFSDSSASYVNLDPNNHHAYKTLYRAAKAKLKLRLRATLGPDPNVAFLPQQAFNETLAGLANLNFGSETTLSPPVPGPSTTSTSSSSIKPQNPEPSVPMVEPASPASDVATTGAAISAHAQSSASASATMAPDAAQSYNCTRNQLLTKLRSCQEKRNSKCPRRSFPAYVPMPTTPQFANMPGPPNLPAGATFSWSVYCNECSKPMLNEHYHCNICENGDYDLCTTCMAQGKHCLDESHWLIKRFLDGSHVMNSTTETITQATKTEAPQGMPGAFTEEKKQEEVEKPTRTCNCCVKVFDEDAFVTCTDCEDYDLCIPCLEGGKHGHHPGHRFEAATSLTVLSTTARTLCNRGRNVNHAAICDECNERIVGVRHKCLICPDWDYCSNCVHKAPVIHRGHRFAPIYDMIPTQHFISSPLHVGVHCDGPLCKDKNSYIGGIRYKCAVCPDIDYCASCEAHPSLGHNRTHPFLKFRNPVRGCKVTMMPPDEEMMKASPTESTSSATQIRTVAEVKPSFSKSMKEKIEIKDLLVDNVDTVTNVMPKEMTPTVKEEKSEPEVKSSDLQAFFIRDTISDGTVFPPEQTFVQVWTLKNPGPHIWPAGCSVRYVGGDNMLNVDDNRPSSDADIEKATESNVIRRPVQIDEEISFRVLMKAPKREGVAISYWRLKAADGMPFGHRLWCHINVTGPSSLSAKDTTRELGRLGSHDNFLRHTLSEQTAKNANRSEGIETIRDALERTIGAKIQAARMDQATRLTRPLEPPFLRSFEANSSTSQHGNLNERLQTLPQISAKRLELVRSQIRESMARATLASHAEMKSSKATSVTPKVEDKVEVAEKAVEPKAEKPASALLFPKLEKLPPASSTHEDQIATNAATPENVPAVAAPARPEDAELFDDAESVSLVEASDDSDSGFLTEDEYDILDASDEDAD